MRVKAHAKINLFLEITGKRPEGYHTLSTVFQTISLADEITFQPARELTLTCPDPALPVDERNLAFRAAMKLQARVRMNLTKKIPLGAGLGGGSSDAAAVLAVLAAPPFAKGGRGGISASALKDCATDLGADVTFFLTGGTCLGEGIGDQITQLPSLPRTWMVLVYPGFGVSTREAYASVRLPFAKPQSVQKFIPLLRKPPEVWVSQLFNRFEEIVFPDYPKLTQLKQELLEAGALGALMSGSGSSVFGIVRSADQGRALLKQIRKRYSQSWLVHTV